MIQPDPFRGLPYDVLVEAKKRLAIVKEMNAIRGSKVAAARRCSDKHGYSATTLEHWRLAYAKHGKAALIPREDPARTRRRTESIRSRLTQQATANQ